MREVPIGTAIRVRTPASSANLGPGFDSIGLALGVWDELSVTVVAEPGLRIEVSGSGADGCGCGTRPFGGCAGRG